MLLYVSLGNAINFKDVVRERDIYSSASVNQIMIVFDCYVSYLFSFCKIRPLSTFYVYRLFNNFVLQLYMPDAYNILFLLLFINNAAFEQHLVDANPKKYF